MTFLLILVLAQGCDPGVSSCAPYGYQSRAAIFGGSGTPDFIVGDPDAQKYGLIQTRQRADFCGNHGDLTIASLLPRTCGWATTWQNPLYGSGAIICGVTNDGSIFSWGNIQVAQNGAGFRNYLSYVGNYGYSHSWIPDVVEGPAVPHYDRNPVWGAFTGYDFPLQVQGNGYVRINDVPLRLEATAEALIITHELADGGTRKAALSWVNQ